MKGRKPEPRVLLRVRQAPRIKPVLGCQPEQHGDWRQPVARHALQRRELDWGMVHVVGDLVCSVPLLTIGDGEHASDTWLLSSWRWLRSRVAELEAASKSQLSAPHNGLRYRLRR